MNPEIKKMFDHFSSDYNTTYLYMTGEQKKIIAYLSPTLFARWYYSALFPETILSPAAIFTSQNENIVLDKGFYSANIHFKNISSDTLNFSYKDNFYSVEDHPIYKDLEILLEYIKPILYIDLDGNMFEKDIHALQKKLSISDRYYVIYLFNLAERLSLFNQMPSLFDNCIQPNIENVFLKLPNSKKLDRIIDESCSLCADNINEEIPFGFSDITSDMIFDLLKNPISIDSIFIKLYQNSDVDLEEIWNSLDTAELSETDTAILSSVYYIGIYFDKAFIFVFGNYLRLIQPIYSFPVKFREIINSLFNSITVDRESETEIFTPCTAYTHTLLGKILFCNQINDKKYPPIPIDKIVSSLNKESAAKVTALECLALTKGTESIYIFRATLNNNKSLWKKIEIESNTTLNAAANYTFPMFMLPEEKEFSIRISNNGKEAAQYITSPQSAFYSSVSPKISDVIPTIGKSIIFSARGNITIELKYIGRTDICSELLYPRIMAQSKEITELEHQIYSLDFLN
ncbi:hypothetical protein SDC9_74957 [bioreactor metagenome]|uniref:Uncharacterized protein n=1 Tax=bioreactor metagenome TaxID=1076179 RepID=A0A644YKM2_9ZZZZ